ncbi:MAG: hypothetical protein HYU84_14615 [Chloroflexi bacterium]|nr:hypothetical protein [Chloroflexota bacterium]MBI3168900.1 hypothetical protein [Chloroflexota bacterium]
MKSKKLIVFLSLIILPMSVTACNVGNLPSTEAFSTAELVLPTLPATPTIMPELPTITPVIPTVVSIVVIETSSLDGGGGASSAGPGGSGGGGPVTVNFVSAPELPTTEAQVTGRFIERRDGNTPANSSDGTKVEVFITSETLIYRDATQLPPGPPSSGQTIQQTVQLATLDELTSEAFITVWGHNDGNRIIADVLLFSIRTMNGAPGSIGPASP